MSMVNGGTHKAVSHTLRVAPPTAITPISPVSWSRWRSLTAEQCQLEWRLPMEQRPERHPYLCRRAATAPSILQKQASSILEPFSQQKEGGVKSDRPRKQHRAESLRRQLDEDNTDKVTRIYKSWVRSVGISKPIETTGEQRWVPWHRDEMRHPSVSMIQGWNPFFAQRRSFSIDNRKGVSNTMFEGQHDREGLPGSSTGSQRNNRPNAINQGQQAESQQPNRQTRLLIHRYEPQPEFVNCCTFGLTRLFLGDPSQPMYQKIKKRIESFDPKGFIWRIHVPIAVGSKPTPRSWAKRRAQQAFIKALQKKGYDCNGKSKDGMVEDLSGALLISYTSDAHRAMRCSVRELEIGSSLVLDTILAKIARQNGAKGRGLLRGRSARTPSLAEEIDTEGALFKY